jgi:hypothetical protein
MYVPQKAKSSCQQKVDRSKFSEKIKIFELINQENYHS